MTGEHVGWCTMVDGGCRRHERWVVWTMYTHIWRVTNKFPEWLLRKLVSYSPDVQMPIDEVAIGYIEWFRQKRDIHLPSPIPNISRVTSIKILGVTISNSLSLRHVNNTIASCAQSVHALRILRSHGLLDDSIYVIYRPIQSGCDCQTNICL